MDTVLQDRTAESAGTGLKHSFPLQRNYHRINLKTFRFQLQLKQHSLQQTTNLSNETLNNNY